MEQPDYFKYWGKAKRDTDTSEGPRWHPLVYHSLDVAAVGLEYLSQNRELSDYFCKLLRCSYADWLKWASFWLALHDLGKFSEAFQSQKPALFSELQKRHPNPEKQYCERHDSLGQWLWKDYLSDHALENKWFGPDVEPFIAGLDMWMRAVTGHHGQPPKVEKCHGMSSDFYSKADKQEVINFIQKIESFFLIGSVRTIPSQLSEIDFEHVSQKLSWWFSGIAVLADWLGSNTDYFPYKEPKLNLVDYWDYAREQAKEALRGSGVLPHLINKNLGLSDLFPKILAPSPLQEWAAEVEITEGPQIYLLEDVTGAGKTEAAIELANRLMSLGNAQGFYVALPTMATANAMYERIANVYRQLFFDDANLSLVHGSRELVEKFASTIVPLQSPENDDEQSDETASARCTAWLADHNKRGLLAQAGVGTIDQALLAVLHSKHQSLRLLGLFRKVLIIDEVHACDAYMQGVLEILLEFHARSGGSAILLSATLPSNMKSKLLRAYSRGCEAVCSSTSNSSYPLATYWQAAASQVLHEDPLETRASVTRTVKVVYLDDLDSVISEVTLALESGQSVCWIRNTVADALDAYKILSQKIQEEKISLFHARFILNDRLQTEEVIKNHFGEKSTAQDRSGKIVIATQVIEQSLDVDFDVIISDLAPIDRILQRAGRLKRHVRDAEGNRLFNSDSVDQRGPPRLLVYGPVWTDNPDASWFKTFLPKAAFVYPDHAHLWLTAKALQKGYFSMPADARPLIEGVFGDLVEIPTGLKGVNLSAEGQNMASASIAKNNTLTFDAGYTRGDVVDWWSEAKTPSRLGDASVNLVLARWEGDRLVPWVNRSQAWAYSTVRVAERQIAKANLPTEKNRLIEYQRVLESLPSKGKWLVLLPFDSDKSGTFQTQAWTSETKNRPAQLLTWQYDSTRGLVRCEDQIEAPEETE